MKNAFQYYICIGICKWWKRTTTMVYAIGIFSVYAITITIFELVYNLDSGIIVTTSIQSVVHDSITTTSNVKASLHDLLVFQKRASEILEDRKDVFHR